MGPNPEHRRLLGQLAEQKELLASARIVGHMKDTHPKVQAMLAKIARLEEQIKETPAEIVVRKVYAGQPHASQGSGAKVALDPMVVIAFQGALGDLELVQQELDRIESDLDPLNKQRNELDALMGNLGPAREKYMEITKKVRECEEELGSWQSRLSTVQMSLAAEFAKRRTLHETVQTADLQYLPSSPSLLKVLGFSIAGALAFGAGLAYLRNLFDRRVTTIEDAREWFGCDIHGVIGEIITNRERTIRKVKRWSLAPLHLLVLACVAGAWLSITLRLRFPEYFQEWCASPFAFVYDKSVGGVVSLIGGLL